MVREELADVSGCFISSCVGCSGCWQEGNLGDEGEIHCNILRHAENTCNQKSDVMKGKVVPRTQQAGARMLLLLRRS